MGLRLLPPDSSDSSDSSDERRGEGGDSEAGSSAMEECDDILKTATRTAIRACWLEREIFSQSEIMVRVPPAYCDLHNVLHFSPNWN